MVYGMTTTTFTQGEQATATARYFRVLGDPTRLAILELLLHQDAPWPSWWRRSARRAAGSPTTWPACAGAASWRPSSRAAR